MALLKLCMTFAAELELLLRHVMHPGALPRSTLPRRLAVSSPFRAQVPKLLAKFDRDQDGRLSLDEFDALARRLVLRSARRGAEKGTASR